MGLCVRDGGLGGILSPTGEEKLWGPGLVAWDYTPSRSPQNCLGSFDPAQADTVQPAAGSSKVFSVAEQFEIIRTLQNVFKHAGHGHKKTLVKRNQLLAADQLSP